MTWTPNLLDTRCGLLPPSAMLQAPCDWRDLPRGHQITPSPRREAVDESSPERYRDDNHETAPPPPVGGRRLQLQKADGAAHTLWAHDAVAFHRRRHRCGGIKEYAGSIPRIE